MSGHSKWSTIKHRKGMADAKRAASFTKLAREIEVAAREKGSDPDMNVRLRLAMDRARSGGMPKDNILRAIERGSGTGATDSAEAVRYEAYGPGGVALLIEGCTDNRNRTSSQVKHLLSKHQASLAAPGSVSYLFEQKGYFVCREPVSSDQEALELALIDAGAEDWFLEDGFFRVFCPASVFSDIQKVLTAHDLSISEAEMGWFASADVSISSEIQEALIRLQSVLEELDDVSNVYSNARFL